MKASLLFGKNPEGARYQHGIRARAGITIQAASSVPHQVSHPIPSSSFVDLALAGWKLLTGNDPLIVHYPPVLRNLIAKQEYPQTKADGRQSGATKENRKVVRFCDHFH